MYCRNADVMKMNLLASFWLRSKCDHPRTGSLSLCVNVYVGISIHRQYTEGLDHKSVLSMCFKARRLQLKGNVRASEWHSCFWASRGEIAELTVSRETGGCEGNVLKIGHVHVRTVHFKAEAPGYLDTQRPRSTWGPKPYYTHSSEVHIFDFQKCL